ncbi:hypothetical protein NPIL_39551 [Nephila pilipes]|uniref:Uncharacterized protein n=1 Tax=Nephila pilipes TaxID=299642 RepID=A0A8X6QS54_NEPPI|nr:hypothetical protein NPIL_39551 [Nephila pilipes]
MRGVRTSDPFPGLRGKTRPHSAALWSGQFNEHQSVSSPFHGEKERAMSESSELFKSVLSLCGTRTPRDTSVISGGYLSNSDKVFLTNDFKSIP